MLCMSSPRLFYLASNKMPLVSDCFVGERGLLECVFKENLASICGVRVCVLIE